MSGIATLLAEHRENAFVTCDETCFCWDVEAFLIAAAVEAERLEANRQLSNLTYGPTPGDPT